MTPLGNLEADTTQSPKETDQGSLLPPSNLETDTTQSPKETDQGSLLPPSNLEADTTQSPKETDQGSLLPPSNLEANSLLSPTTSDHGSLLPPSNLEPDHTLSFLLSGCHHSQPDRKCLFYFPFDPFSRPNPSYYNDPSSVSTYRPKQPPIIGPSSKNAT
jgi:hypothetical protein